MEKLNPDLKKQWIEALRSGDYQQCRAKLTDGKGYCCLGVLAKISDRLDENGRFKHSKNIGSPCALSGGLSCEILHFTTQSKLMGENDSGKTFAEIADMIEKDEEI